MKPIDRVDKFLELLPKNNYNVTKTAIQSGYSESYASKNQKTLMKTAMRRYHTNALEEIKDHNTGARDLKRTIAQEIGMDKDRLFELYRELLEQDRDYAVRLRALEPALRSEGLEIDSKEEKTFAPSLNITVKDPNDPPKSEEGVSHG